VYKRRHLFAPKNEKNYKIGEGYQSKGGRGLSCTDILADAVNPVYFLVGISHNQLFYFETAVGSH